MNNERKLALQKAIEFLRQAGDIIEDSLSDESDDYDRLPEEIQDSGIGESLSDNIDNLEECSNDLDDVISKLEDIIGGNKNSKTFKIVIKRTVDI